MSLLRAANFRFDPTRMAAGLRLDNDGFTVEQVNSTSTHKIAVLNKGFSTGRVYFEFVILEPGPHSHIMVGVTDESQGNMLTTSFFPGPSSCG